ncbi:hypothetical protein CLV31_12017 [Algoriphagus aquaeductus]|uniref:Uncharacterized protein n=1 Tax=Algoriphagus aquaeductus TaxID=475299 RepID=A0A326RMU1_9BACT|nr:hypothetical protein [Algoriphagus aquaeductus]PZV77549.1 hypothetical protein CLV31_12017 [Algoriphagus aquaeductus]
MMPEEEYDKHPKTAKKGPAKGDLFIRIHPILIPDFCRAGEAMPELQKSPSKTSLEGLKKIQFFDYMLILVGRIYFLT